MSIPLANENPAIFALYCHPFRFSQFLLVLSSSFLLCFELLGLELLDYFNNLGKDGQRIGLYLKAVDFSGSSKVHF
jgi:hypothetical protein